MTTIKRERPLSPHLQVYRPQLTSILSIIHRATGVALSVGAFAVAGWLYAAASDASTFLMVQGWIASPLGCVAVFGFAYALMYHLLNGIRHLCWDAGWGLEIDQTYRSGWAVVVVSIILTAGLWWLTRSGGLA